MENSTKIIIGSSVAIVGIAAAYFIISRKKNSSKPSGIVDLSPGALPPTDVNVGAGLPTTDIVSGINIDQSDTLPVAQKKTAIINPRDIRPTDANYNTSATLPVAQKKTAIINPRDIRPTDANYNTSAPMLGLTATNLPPVGKLLRTFCDGVRSMGEYADGLGGKVVKVINDKAPACGYIPPSTEFSDKNDYPEVTMMLITELKDRLPGLYASLKKWWDEEMKFKNPNFDSTAAQHGNKSLYQYAIQEMFRHGYGMRRCSVNRDMNDFLIDKRGSNSNSLDFNEWGRNVVNNKDHFNCDYKTERLTLAYINARDVQRANAAGISARKVAGDLITAYKEMFTI